MKHRWNMIPVVVDDIAASGRKMRPIDFPYGKPMIEYMYSIGNPGSTFDKTFDYTFQDKNMVLMPFFMAGHPLEIAQRLPDKDKDKVYKYQKYR